MKMTNAAEFQLIQQIQLLQPDNLDELRLFIEFLLSKQKKVVRKKKVDKPRRQLLSGMKPILVPVDNVIIDRASIYEDRF